MSTLHTQTMEAALLKLTAVVAASLAFSPGRGTALAQEKFPTKPIRFLVGAPPGGSNDIFARAIGLRLKTARADYEVRYAKKA